MSKCRIYFCICAACILMMFSLITACAPSDNNINTPNSEKYECISSAVSGLSNAESNPNDKPITESRATENADESKEHIVNDILTPERIPNDMLVLIAQYAPDIILDIRYATTNNFTHSVIYASSDAYIRYGTLQKLISVQNELRTYGFGLKIWDAYRPVEAQFKLWSICPNSDFVANPNNGYSNHSRGNTIDVTMVTLDGKDVEMPSEFDDFSVKAHRDYTDDTTEVANNARLLETIMKKHGFTGYKNEWWHFTDTISYPVVK